MSANDTAQVTGGKILRRSVIALAAVGVLAGGIAVVWWRFNAGPELPKPDLSNVGAGVKSAINDALNEVHNKPGDADAWGHLAMTLMAHEFYSESIHSFKQAEMLDPDEARWPYLRAVVMLILPEPDPLTAIACLQKTVAVCGNEPCAPRLKLARLHLEEGRLDAAERGFQELLRHQPKHVAGSLGMAHIYFRKGKLKKSLGTLGTSLQDPHTRKAAYTLSAELHEQLGNSKEAARAAAILQGLPEDLPWPDPYFSELRTIRKARSEYKQRIRQLTHEGTLKQANLLRQMAETQYEELRFYREGLDHLKRRAYASAEKSFRAAINRDPVYLEAHYNLGLALAVQLKLEQAEEVLRHCVRLEPSYQKAHVLLGQCLQKRGKDADALASFEAAVRYSPLNADAHFLLGKHLAKLGRDQLAIEQLRDAVRLDPTHEEARKMLKQLMNKKSSEH